MHSDIVAMLVVLVALGGLIGSLAALRKQSQFGGEASRKAVHIGMGCIVAAFPWMFERSWPVGVLALLACSVVASLVFIPSLNAVLRSVDRKSHGELYFPVATAFAFHYSQGDPVLYCPPILMLTFGDSLAALIGSRFGKMKFTTHEGFKTWEGSLAFFLATFMTTFLSLSLLSDYSIAKIIIVSVLLGVIGFMIEGFAWKGLDNLFIPVFGLVAMEAYHSLDATSLVIRLAVLLGLIALCFARKAQSTMNDSALLGTALVLYLIWALAGWMWVLPPILFFLLFTRVVSFDYRKYQNFQSVTALLGIGTVPFFWIGQSIRADDPERMIWPFTSALAIHLAAIWSKRAKTQGRQSVAVMAAVIAPASACFAIQLLPIGIAYWTIDADFIRMAVSGFLVCVPLSIVVALWSRFDKQPVFTLEEWVFRNVLSLAGSTVIMMWS